MSEGYQTEAFSKFIEKGAGRRSVSRYQAWVKEPPYQQNEDYKPKEKEVFITALKLISSKSTELTNSSHSESKNIKKDLKKAMSVVEGKFRKAFPWYVCGDRVKTMRVLGDLVILLRDKIANADEEREDWRKQIAAIILGLSDFILEKFIQVENQ